MHRRRESRDTSFQHKGEGENECSSSELEGGMGLPPSPTAGSGSLDCLTTGTTSLGEVYAIINIR